MYTRSMSADLKAFRVRATLTLLNPVPGKQRVMHEDAPTVRVLKKRASKQNCGPVGGSDVG